MPRVQATTGHNSTVLARPGRCPRSTSPRHLREKTKGFTSSGASEKHGSTAERETILSFLMAPHKHAFPRTGGRTDGWFSLKIT